MFVVNSLIVVNSLSATMKTTEYVCTAAMHVSCFRNGNQPPVVMDTFLNHESCMSVTM